MKIEIKKAAKVIAGTEILRNINLDMQSGMIYGLYGPNGSGKTMLMRMIAGLIYPTSGSIEIDAQQLGKDIDFPPSMGLLIENSTFLPNYTGFKNLQLLAQIRCNISDADICRTITNVGLFPEDKRKFKKYSLGMKQRLGVAAAIMEHPDLIILDEPTNALDTAGINQIVNLLHSEKERGALIIMSSHNDEILRSISDSLIYINNGYAEIKY